MNTDATDCGGLDLDQLAAAAAERAAREARAIFARGRRLLDRRDDDTAALEGCRVEALSYAPRAFAPWSDRLRTLAAELRERRDQLDTYAQRPDVGSCPRCGQAMIGSATVCGSCREAERAPQGEALSLFDMPRALPAAQPEGLF